MIELKRINGSMVTPKDDALLFDYLFSGSGIFEGVEVTHLGANQLLVTDGRGMILGRDFVVAEETILAQLSPSGTQRGRLLVRIDMANTEIPIVIATQIGAVLPELVQEDINRDGTIYELAIVEYDATELQISNIVRVAPNISKAEMLKKADISNTLTTTTEGKVLDARQGTVLQDGKVDKVAGKGLSQNDYDDDEKQKVADALPTTGGTMTGTLVAGGTQVLGTPQVRNIVVQSTQPTGATGLIWIEV